MKASLKFLTLLSCAGLAVIGCRPIEPEYPDYGDENPPAEQPDEPTEEPLTDGSIFTIQLNDEIMATVGTGTWNAIAYGNGRYVAVGNDGSIAYSTDGVNWTRKQVENDIWYDIVFNSKVGRFVAVGPNGYNGYSSDGINWTQVTTKYNYTAVGVEPTRNMFIAVRSVGSHYGISSQGTTWSEYSQDCGGYGIAAGNSELISVGYGEINIFKYPSWKEPIEVENNYVSIVYNPDKNEYLAVGQIGYVAKSTNGGSTWTETKTNLSGAFMSVDYSSELGMYVAVCNSGKGIATSEDGINWDVKQTDSNSMECLLVMQ